jgi:pSer/pThr/pTyr-binding forkhead associated (FHA) protein
MTANLDRVVVRLDGVVVDSIAIDQQILTIGRSADTALTLPHPRVSRHHAEIRRNADATAIVDLGSANGIIVAGERIPAHQTLPLAPGTVVQIGPYTLTFQTPDGPERPAGDLSDQTIMDMRADLKIHIDARQRQGQVEAITESDFFRRLSEEKRRLRPNGPRPPAEEES